MKVLVCVLSVMVILEGYEIKCCLQNERDGLLQIKSYFSSFANGSNPFPKWAVGDEKSDCCEWERVKCSPSTGHVTHLYLNSTTLSDASRWSLNMALFHPFQELRTLDLSNNLIGSLVQSEGLGTLKNLESLDLSVNDGTDSPFPDLLWNLSSLRVLDLSGSEFTGQIDAGLCKLRKIRELHFAHNRFNGSLPDCLWNLTSLQVLDLLDNSFSGNLPSSINLPSLEWLSIKDNNFQGKFSLSSLRNHSSLKILMLSNNALQVEIGDSQSLSTMQLQVLGLGKCNLSSHTKSLQNFFSFQSNLQYLDLSGNSLVGSFPTWLLQNSSKLHLLNLGSNSLTGELPQNLNTSLLFLSISSNQFSGNIPPHIGMSLSALRRLQMSNNLFHGVIPSSLSNMTQLEVLDISFNKLYAEVPKNLLSDCSNLEFLVLSDNKLEGEIIPSSMNLSSLFVLSLDNNQFVGTINESLNISTGLSYLDISNNKATGELPYWIGSLSSLLLLSLARNQFHGKIPSQICNIDSLQYLDLSENRFTGRIPSCGCPSSLTSLHLQGNRLTGPIPKGLQRCSSLQVLNLASNQISGGIPRWIDVFSILTIVRLRDNQIQGELPIQLCQLQRVNIIDLSNNSISGAIPSCLPNISFGALDAFFPRDFGSILTGTYSLTLSPSKNHYIFQEHEDVEQSKYEEEYFNVKSRYDSYKGEDLSILSTLDLSGNRFTGYIPPELGEMILLNTMNISHNFLSGPIPESFSKLKSIESLDLSWNRLSGTIPLQLVDLNFLEVFNVSYNNLSGGVPDTMQFSTFDSSSYLGNPLLCGSRLPKSCIVKEPPSSPSTDLGDEGETAFDLKVFFWSFGGSFIIVLLSFFLVLYISEDWQRAWFAFIDLHFLWWLYY